MAGKISAMLFITAYLLLSACKDESPSIANEKVAPDFQSSDTIIDLNQTVSFYDISKGNPDKWVWEFEGGNPSFSFERNPQILYEKAGVYDVKLIVQNDISINSIIKKDHITVENSAPVQFELTWQKSISEFFQSEIVNSFIKTSDGGYLSLGWIWLSNENTDISLIKYDENLNVVWQKIFSGNKSDMGGSLIETSDGNYMAAGYTNSTEGDIIGTHGGYDVFLFKFDDSGNILWQKTYGGSEDEYCENLSLIELLDHTLMISATSGSNDGDVSFNHGGLDLWVVSLNSSGGIVKEKCFGGSMDEYARQILPIGEDFLVGFKNGSNDGDFLAAGNFVSMIDQNGEIKWKTNLGGWNYGKTIADKNGGFISLIGNIARSSDFEIARISESGSIIKKFSFGGSKQEFGRDLIQLDDGSLIILGTSASGDGEIPGNYGKEDLILSKLSPSGNQLWVRHIGGSQTEWANCILSLGNEEYLINASTASDDYNVLENFGKTGIDNWLIKVKVSQ
jgi:PKD repeat protein